MFLFWLFWPMVVASVTHAIVRRITGKEPNAKVRYFAERFAEITRDIMKPVQSPKKGIFMSNPMDIVKSVPKKIRKDVLITAAVSVTVGAAGGALAYKQFGNGQTVMPAVTAETAK